jgi:RNA polymerase sigma-70 factor (ECF subfamily)
MREKMDDSRIIKLYEERNELAISATSQKYGSYCFSIANKILENVEDADECVNDTWLKAWNLIPPQIPTYLNLFLAKIVRNLSFDKYRREHALKRGNGEISLVMEELEEVVADGNDVEASYEMKELIDEINKYLHTLPEKECNIFIRRYFYMEGVVEIANKYQMKQGNVSMILSRTRKKLKNYLEERELV